MASYTIKAGDTLGTLARRHGTTVQALMAANPSIRNPHLIIAGQVLRMPGDRLELSSRARPASPATAGNAPLAGAVRKASAAATAHYLGQARMCFSTAELTAKKLGGSLLTGRSSTSARGLPIAHLAESLAAGKLKPGMAVYVSLNPGTDPRSLNMANLPHWFTYVGRDAQGVMRFSDQYGDNFSLAQMAAQYAPRVIDEIIDPIPHRR